MWSINLHIQHSRIHQPPGLQKCWSICTSALPQIILHSYPLNQRNIYVSPWSLHVNPKRIDNLPAGRWLAWSIIAVRVSGAVLTQQLETGKRSKRGWWWVDVWIEVIYGVCEYRVWDVGYCGCIADMSDKINIKILKTGSWKKNFSHLRGWGDTFCVCCRYVSVLQMSGRRSWHKEPRQVSQIFFEPEYHAGIIRVSPQYHLSVR